MLNVNTAANFAKITESDQSVSIREQIIATGRLSEKGGIGFSILLPLGVSFPDVKQFRLSDCMREDEIHETWQMLNAGKKVWWEGGDGYGKTTFLGEFGMFITAENEQRSTDNRLRIIHLDEITHGNINDIQKAISRIEYYLVEGKDDAANIVYILDSTDFLWEQVKGEEWLGKTAQKRLELLSKLLTSSCKVVMTAHDREPKNKKVDPITKDKCAKILDAYSVLKKKLSPLYPQDKMVKVLTRVGFPSILINKLFEGDFFYPLLHHGLMTNYILGDQDQYRLTDLLSYIDSALKTMSIDDLTIVIKKSIIYQKFSKNSRLVRKRILKLTVDSS